MAHAEHKTYRLKFDRSLKEDHQVEAPWIAAPPKRIHHRTGLRKPAELRREYAAPWGKFRDLALHNRAGWERLARSEFLSELPWQSPPTKPRDHDLPWEDLPIQDRTVVEPYASPPARDFKRIFPWDELPARDRELRDPWSMPPPNDEHHATLWGPNHYARICFRDYLLPVGDGLVVDLGRDINSTGDGDHCDVLFDALSYDERCSMREPSGWRDQYIFLEPRTYPAAPVLRVYRVMNNVLLTRVSDSAPIDVAAMRLSADLGAWCWGFEATLNSREALDLVRPVSGVPVLVEVNINGFLWRVLVEGWRENKRFAGGGWTITGRSQSAQLAKPYAPARSYSETEARSAIQLAEAELLNTGFTLDWQQVDWLVSGGAWSYQNLTPLDAIKKIAAAAGGVVLSHVTDQVLIVQSKYPVDPWDFATATPEVALPDSLFREMGAEWRPAPAYNAVFVSGEGQGVQVKVTREGTAGDLLAGDVVDPLITEVAAGMERGRNILGAGGEWSFTRVSVPLFADPGIPGLILPGGLVEVQETGLAAWRGQVRSCSVSASRGNGLRVSQDLELGRFHG